LKPFPDQQSADYLQPLQQMEKSYLRLAGFLGGLVLFTVFFFTTPFNIDEKGMKVLAIAALMILWWITDAMPMPIVALIPIVLFPLLKVCTIEEAAAPFANPVIFLFLGGFMIGLALEKWNLHKRIALGIINLTGTSGNRIILGFILSTGFLSMWLSNTATTMMMFPIAMSVITVMDQRKDHGNTRNFSICILLAIAYAANIGGIATIIGTPPNVAYVAFLEKHNQYSFPFSGWMLLCFPLSILLLITLYLVLVKFLFPNKITKDPATSQLIKLELKELGKLSATEKRVLGIFLFTATMWITKDIINGFQTRFRLDDATIAIMGTFLLFLIPAKKNNNSDSYTSILKWKDTEKMSWGILLLFGGGISLASQLEKAGLIESLGNWIASFAPGGFILILIISLVSIFISEVMSNVAQVIVFAPVVAGIAESLHINPLQPGLAMTLAASCAGMLPMGTPPNAIVFASGKLKLRDMAMTGFIMNIVAVIFISLFCWFLLPMILNIIP
jgi:solute carrier family 13 (sodium-dependent dicarboxylate transporter), member 2/3/5